MGLSRASSVQTRDDKIGILGVRVQFIGLCCHAAVGLGKLTASDQGDLDYLLHWRSTRHSLNLMYNHPAAMGHMGRKKLENQGAYPIDCNLKC